MATYPNCTGDRELKWFITPLVIMDIGAGYVILHDDLHPTRELRLIFIVSLK